jgi:hypothetical protein
MKQYNSLTMKKTGLIILILVILAGAAAFIIYKYGNKKPSSEIVPENVNKNADLQLAGKRLWTDYSMNKDIADPKYTGKVIEIKGSIMRVETVDNDVIVVFAFKKGEKGDEGIRVTMLPAYGQASKGINPFKDVRIKGLCNGYIDRNVVMVEGSIVGNQ